MPTLTCTAARPERSPGLDLLRRWPAEVLARERRLAIYGALLLVLMLPMALAFGLDDRVLRGANVWIKPLKFALSISVLSFTSAWFVGALPAAQRAGRAVSTIAWLIIGAGSFELAYIALQAALGQGSHYNVADPFHATMYALMGVGALTLTATQPMLAWLLFRHPDAGRPAAYRLAVLLGLTATFVFGAGVGGLLSSMQPPSGGATVPLLGWALHGGDLRPAHFVGIHAEQLLALIGFAASSARKHATKLVWLAFAGYAALFVVLLLSGLAGRG